MDEAQVASLKRFGVMFSGVAVVALNKKLGLSLSDVDIGSISTLLVTYLLQSVWHSNKKLQAEAQANADATVQTSAAAAKVFNGPSTKLLVFVLLGALVLPRPAFAEDAPPSDAPKKVQAVAVTGGFVTPTPGTFLPSPLDIEEAKRIVACEDERDKLRAQGPPAWVVLVSILGGGLIGAGAVIHFKK